MCRTLAEQRFQLTPRHLKDKLAECRPGAKEHNRHFDVPLWICGSSRLCEKWAQALTTWMCLIIRRYFASCACGELSMRSMFSATSSSFLIATLFGVALYASCETHVALQHTISVCTRDCGVCSFQWLNAPAVQEAGLSLQLPLCAFAVPL